MNKKLFLFLIFVFLVFSLIYFVKKQITRNNHKSLEISSKYFNLEKKNIPETLIKEIPMINEVISLENAFKFFVRKDELILYSTDSVLITNSKNQKLTRYAFKNILNVWPVDDNLLVYPFFDSVYQVIDRNKNVLETKIFKHKNCPIINTPEGLFFQDSRNNKTNGDLEYYIQKENDSNIVFLSKIINEKLDTSQKNLTSFYTNGLFFSYSKDTVGYFCLSYDLILLINKHDSKYREVNTKSKYNFIPANAVIVKAPNSDVRMMKIEKSINQEYIHTSITSNNRFVFIKSNFDETDSIGNVFEFIDVYEKHSFKYLYTFKRSAGAKKVLNKIIEMDSNDSTLFFLCVDKIVRSFKI
jgi:hypothetical protein